ncbi:amidohydrolase family protein [Chitinophaga sp. NPDC101104]|uniref:amidohydrolase family protein n=1 Tax=Chitinophaga sp. NPDC101104 TaxID=3390561 RepID=UPI003CFCCD26
MRYAVLIVLNFICGTGASAQQLLLKNVTIIDGDAAVQPRRASVLINNGVIREIYTKVPRKLPNTETIDCSGKFLAPGLADAHVHLATAVDEDLSKARRETDSIMENMVRHGITSVRDMAGDAPYLAALKRDVHSGKTIGPDICYAAQFAGPGYFDLVRRSGRDGDLGNSAWYKAIFPGVDITAAIRAARDAGVTGIKIYADLSAQQLRDITTAAHQAGLQAWSHAAVFPCKPGTGVEAGVNSMSHANDFAFQQLPGDTLEIGKAWGALYKKDFRLDTVVIEKLMQRMAVKSIFLDPTVFHAENNKMHSAAIVTRIAHRNGVKIVTGTDWIYPTTGEVPLLQEMLLLQQKCGMNAAEVIHAATLNSANVCGQYDRGRVRPGMRADLLLLGADPLQDLRVLFRPLQVFLKGKPILQ